MKGPARLLGGDPALPKDPEPYNSRAWLRATCPEPKYRDGKAAVADATRACELSAWKDAYHLGTLAAAHGEAGDFALAIELQERANPLDTDPAARAAGEARLKLYRARAPYRDSQ